MTDTHTEQILFVRFTFIAGVMLTLAGYLLEDLGFDLHSLAIACGAFYAVVSARLYGLLVEQLTGQSQNRSASCWILKITLMLLLFSCITRVSSAQALAVLVGVFSFLPAALAVAFTKKPRCESG